MPLITAGLGLITGVALIGLATHVTSMSNVSPELALMIGLGVGVDYALFIVTRFRENHERVRRRAAGAPRGDGHVGTGDPAGRDDGRDRPAGDVRNRRELHVRPGDRGRDRRAVHDARLAHGAPGDALALRRPARPANPRGAAPRGGGSTAARVPVAPVEPDGAGASVAARHRLARVDARFPGPGDPAPPRQQRRGQRSEQHQYAPRLRSALPGLRARLQRPAPARRGAPGPGPDRGPARGRGCRRVDPRCRAGHAAAAQPGRHGGGDPGLIRPPHPRRAPLPTWSTTCATTSCLRSSGGQGPRS